jgi:hypothetical protein
MDSGDARKTAVVVPADPPWSVERFGSRWLLQMQSPRGVRATSSLPLQPRRVRRRGKFCSVHRSGTTSQREATGEIALGNDASGSPGHGDTWDGVALALLADPIALRRAEIEASRGKRPPKKQDADAATGKPVAAVAP